ncbi:histidine phosphatase family protein [Streptomyces tricolor]|uniref:histidine phosphatase family protein n=1 Tax=Streptomyces tricolor TaxID=68277 RepID=UPI003D70D9E4
MSASPRQACSDDGGPLDGSGAARARSAAGRCPPRSGCRSPPACAGRRRPGPWAWRAHRHRSCGAGRRRGRTPDEAAAVEPEAADRRLADPGSAPHGGESVEDRRGRVARRLAGARAVTGPTLAAVEPEAVRAAVAAARGIPAVGLRRLDAPPPTVTELSGRDGHGIRAWSAPATENARGPPGGPRGPSAVRKRSVRGRNRPLPYGRLPPRAQQPLGRLTEREAEPVRLAGPSRTCGATGARPRPPPTGVDCPRAGWTALCPMGPERPDSVGRAGLRDPRGGAAG